MNNLLLEKLVLVVLLNFGIRPFEFSDFISMIGEGTLDVTQVDYCDIVASSLKRSGNLFRHFEVTCDLAYVLPGFFNSNTMQRLKEFRIRKNYTCSIHLPLWGIELASPNAYIREGSIDCMINAIEMTKILDPICWVIHATGSLVSEFNQLNLPEIGKQFMSDHFANTAEESLNHILEATQIEPRKLAVENVEFSFRNMEDCLENLNLSICFDTGHVLAGYSGEWNRGVLEFINNYYDRIVELHLHDGKIPRIDHKPLGKFNLPVPDLLNELLEKKFEGPIVFELNPAEVEESIAYIRTTVPKAIKN
jgi:sugar phosphate isomerase/epimerase